MKKLYVIEWIDSHMPSENNWQRIEYMKKPRSVICVSVGWILKETKDNIVITPHISDIKNKKDKGCACGLMTIPKAAMLKRTELKYKL